MRIHRTEHTRWGGEEDINPSTHNFDAVIFDMDGVITRTTDVHAAAWQELFDAYLRMRATRDEKPFHPFDRKLDYLTYVDGKPRYEGVKSFLVSRGIKLPHGDPTDDLDKETICGLGNRKDKLFEQHLHHNGVAVFESTVALIGALKSRGIKIGMVTSSKHGREILDAADIASLFDARIDGVIAESLALKGKPDPDIFIKCAELLQVENARSVVVEDSAAGVEAGRQGGFGFVIGVDRGSNRKALEQSGADIVVADVSELDIEDIDTWFEGKIPTPGSPKA